MILILVLKQNIYNLKLLIKAINLIIIKIIN